MWKLHKSEEIHSKEKDFNQILQVQADQKLSWRKSKTKEDKDWTPNLKTEEKEKGFEFFFVSKGLEIRKDWWAKKLQEEILMNGKETSWIGEKNERSTYPRFWKKSN